MLSHLKAIYVIYKSKIYNKFDKKSVLENILNNEDIYTNKIIPKVIKQKMKLFRHFSGVVLN